MVAYGCRISFFCDIKLHTSSNHISYSIHLRQEWVHLLWLILCGQVVDLVAVMEGNMMDFCSGFEENIPASEIKTANLDVAIIFMKKLKRKLKLKLNLFLYTRIIPKFHLR